MRILVIQLKRIGDLVLTTPVLRALAEKMPHARVTVVTNKACEELARGLRARRVIVLRNAWDTIRTGLWARGRSFDAILDFSGTDRSAFLTALAGARHKITYERFRRKGPVRSRVYNRFVDASVQDLHTADYHLALLKALGIKMRGLPSEIHFSERSLCKAESILKKKHISPPFAVIHPGTARSEKYWQPEKWARIANHLKEHHGLTCVITGTKAADEKRHVDAILSGAPHTISLLGKCKLLETAAIIQKARIFCGVDTAAMHLADAVHTPVVALFGPTNPRHWSPRHTVHRVVGADNSGKSVAMQDITVEDVQNAIDHVLIKEKEAVA